MTKTSKYWDDRALRRLTGAEKTSEEYIKRVRKMYDKAYRDVNKEIDKIYKTYSKKTGVDVDTLKTLLTKKETSKVFKDLKAKGYDKYIKDNYKSRITRLEQLKAQIYEKAKDVYSAEELINHECYKEVVKNSYYKAIYDTQMGTMYDFNFGVLDDNLVKAVLNERWSGKNYKARVWGNTDILAESVSEIVGGAIISGQSLSKTTKQIRERFGVGKYYAERLIRTETNHFYNEADAMAYEEMGIDKYVFVAVLDNRTSRMCQDMDNVVKDYKDKEVGVNFPPLHPNCRSTTRGYINEEVEKSLKRRARNPKTGKTEIIDNMSYKEWAKRNGLDVAVTKRGGQLPAKPKVDTSKDVLQSVVRDKNGKLLKMYHGTASNFTSFDINKIREVDYDAPFNGFWFSSDKNTSPAMQNAKYVKEVELYINNPAPYDVWSKVAKEVEQEQYDFYNNIYTNGGDYNSKPTGFNKLSRSTNDEVRYRLQDMGYDGIHWDGKPNIDIEELEKKGTTRFTSASGRTDYIFEKTKNGYDLKYTDGEIITSYNSIDEYLDTLNEEWVAFDPKQIKIINQDINNVPKTIKNLFKTENLPRWFKTYMGEVDSEGEFLVDWLNKNGDPNSKASKVFSNSIKDLGMAKGDIDKQTFIHYRDSGGTFRREIYLNTIEVPRISDKDDPRGSIQTFLHENWHAIDFNKAGGNDFISTLSDKLKKVIRDDDNSISDDVRKLFEEYNEKCREISERLREEHKHIFDELNKKYEAGKYKSYRSYSSAWNKERKKLIDLIDYEERNALNGVNNLQDIYDALSKGKLRDDKVVKYGHGTKYYKKGGVDAQVKEILANYGALAMTRPDLIELLKADKPNLVKELEALLDSIE